MHEDNKLLKKIATIIGYIFGIVLIGCLTAVVAAGCIKLISIMI